MKKVDNREHQAFSHRLLQTIEECGFEASPEKVLDGILKQSSNAQVTLPAVRRWLAGQAIPRRHNMKALSDWLGVPPCYLAYGENFSAIQVAKIANKAVTGELLHTLERFLALDVSQRQTVQEIIRALSFQKNEEALAPVSVTMTPDPARADSASG